MRKLCVGCRVFFFAEVFLMGIFRTFWMKCTLRVKEAAIAELNCCSNFQVDISMEKTGKPLFYSISRHKKNRKNIAL